MGAAQRSPVPARIRRYHTAALLLCGLTTSLLGHASDSQTNMPVLEAGHPDLQEWLLPDTPPAPQDNRLTPARAALGKQLFFDPRLSGTGQVTCASCHFPERAWADGLPTAVRFKGRVMHRASPVLTNIGFNKILMWDGRKRTLEDQAFGGQGKKADINAGSRVEPETVIERLNRIPGYVSSFAQAYPGEGLTRKSVARAIASFERTIISNNSPFDRWVRGDASAMSKQQVNGFRLFLDRDKGNCIACHDAPNFTNDGLHNIGLKSFGAPDHDRGAGKLKPLKILDGAFKTPTLRDIALSAPYFHDGSAATLEDVVKHYVDGGADKSNLSPEFKQARLDAQEQQDLIAFLRALTTPPEVFVYPLLPQ